jgi:hypothetical protein
MTDPVEDLQPPATFEQPTWKPKHRVDPRRPANPHTADSQLEHLYEQRLQEARFSAPSDHSFLWGLLCVLFIAAIIAVVVWGLWLS